MKTNRLKNLFWELFSSEGDKKGNPRLERSMLEELEEGKKKKENLEKQVNQN